MSRIRQRSAFRAMIALHPRSRKRTALGIPGAALFLFTGGMRREAFPAREDMVGYYQRLMGHNHRAAGTYAATSPPPGRPPEPR
ncbi:exported hypothetical protein [Nitrolancea hollandica Lb]|uniref:Uncharacterized protein n=1 Tax=Nitrolancea hollandica Lb TaxID=1129897 RepID=I4EIN0_9BACT|nr:exported hypothetical protein [Nitrolancea hollandica Lb]